jgi:SAM-dependent methyltransferase
VSAVPSCRSCGEKGLLQFLSLGPTPLTDAYVPSDLVGEPEPRYPLDLAFCPACSLVQILFTVPAEEIFERYSYYSSFSETLLSHSREHVRQLIAERQLGPASLVIEVASNDGYLLQNFVGQGVPVLGVDPARGPADAAEAIGVPTLREFFGTELAATLKSQGKVADVVIANNVLAHVPDLNGFVEGIAIILAEEGVAEIEIPYVRDMIDKLEFDTIYHEHLCYFSVTALDRLFRRHGLSLQRVQAFLIHGGSLRLTVGRHPDVGTSVKTYLQQEGAAGLNGFGYYRHFADRVTELRSGLRTKLKEIRSKGKRIAGYGAAAKGTVLLNSSGIGSDLIDFVADKSPYKQGKFMPGVGIPIVSTEWLLEKSPDYVLLLVWNLKDEVFQEQRAYLDAGGRFIVPIPAPIEVGKEDVPAALSG